MKKIENKKTAVLSLIVLALCCLGTATAQDTIHRNRPLDNYYCNYWYESHPGDMLSYMLRGTYTTRVGGKYFNTKDTLRVYGIAAALGTYLSGGDSIYYIPGRGFDSTTYYQDMADMCDTSDYANAYEYLSIYKAVADSIVPFSPQLMVNIKTSTPAYYLDFGTYGNIFQIHTKPYAVYELYFDNPQIVTDSFYICMTNRVHTMADCGNSYFPFYHTWPVLNLIYQIPYMQYDTGFVPERRISWLGYPPSWTHSIDYALTYVFPILDSTAISHHAGDTTYIGDTLVVTDTIIIGGDTIITTDTILSIQNGSLLDRLTGVMPNPAVGTAKVVSSFGMSMVEAYDMSGTLVHRQKADGLATTLDVRHWPTGTYLLRIHTPQGTATKKLVVRR